MEEAFEKTKSKRPSRWHYLLPIFFGILGGIAGYLLVHERDKNFARRLIIVGIIFTILIPIGFLGLTTLLSGLSYLYLTQVQTFEETSSGLAIIDSFCSGGAQANVVLRNLGTSSIDANDITVTRTAGAGTTSLSWSTTSIAPGTTTTLKDSGCTTSGNPANCIYRITSSIGESRAIVSCTG